jgi:hypothetical protein
MPTPGESTGAETRVMGAEDAALKIIAFVPTEAGCHDATVAALMESYEAYPDDIHLTLVDFFGPDRNEWAEKLRVTCATVTINGEKTFDLEGRRVSFEKAEGGTYIAPDLNAVIDAEIERVKG